MKELRFNVIQYRECLVTGGLGKTTLAADEDYVTSMAVYNNFKHRDGQLNEFKFTFTEIKIELIVDTNNIPT